MLLGASVALSRVVGYVREIVLANQLGAGPKTDAYMAAFTIPDVKQFSWPHPVIANGKLYLREQDTLYVYDVRRSDGAAKQGAGSMP